MQQVALGEGLCNKGKISEKKKKKKKTKNF